MYRIIDTKERTEVKGLRYYYLSCANSKMRRMNLGEKGRYRVDICPRVMQ